MTIPILTNVETIPIAIADDSQLFVQALDALLDFQGITKTLFTVNSGEALLKELEQSQPEVILMDIRMPDMDGLKATAKVKEQFPGIKVIILSNYNDPYSVKKALKAGADGYLLKDIGSAELQTAIEKVAIEEIYFCKKVQEIINSYLTKKQVDFGNCSAVLSIITPTEHQILLLICEAYTSDEIAAIRHISKNTVETHRKNLLWKLDCRNAIELVKWAIRHNLYKP